MFLTVVDLLAGLLQN